MNKISKLYVALVVSFSALLFACHKKPENGEGPMESAGEELDQTSQDVSEKSEEARDDANDKIEEAGDKIEDKTD